MTQTTAGSCQCGTVTFQVSGEFESFFLCHCKRCRKDTGSAHAANLFSSTATLSWISGSDSIRTYRVPETLHEKSFCTKCGSALPSVQLNGALLVVPAGSINSAITIRPTAHICCASRAEWDAHLETIPQLDGLPG
ncbi:MAG TPA: GFA family protein [Devosia sp.]|nr:GFA family protein [Devosia sp.]